MVYNTVNEMRMFKYELMKQIDRRETAIKNCLDEGVYDLTIDVVKEANLITFEIVINDLLTTYEIDRLFKRLKDLFDDYTLSAKKDKIIIYAEKVYEN